MKEKKSIANCLKTVLMQRALTIRNSFFKKLEYIHLNPIRGKWQLVGDWRMYQHSSASFYELNTTMHYEPVHYKELQ